MTAKEYLMRAWRIDAHIERKIEERERLMARLTAGRTASVTGLPRGSGYDWTDAVAKLVEMDARIGREITELCRVKRECIEAIEGVEDARCRWLLELRYRNYMTWEAIAEIMHYDVRHVQRIHGEALRLVKIPRGE